MTNAPTPTEKSKKQRDIIKNATKNFDYTTIADRLMMFSWCNSRHPHWCGKTGLRALNLPTDHNSHVSKRSHIYKWVNNPPYRDWGPTANQSREVIKMWYTNIYSNIVVYQKYIGTSIKVGCATRSLYASSSQKAEGVQTNNQRGRGSGPCRLWGGLDKARHVVKV